MLATAHGAEPSILLLIPFAILLLAIAIGPLAIKHTWERYYHWVAIVLGSITLTYYLTVLRQPEPMLHTAIEYGSFIVFVGSLFIVTGGIHIRVKGEATPGINCLYLLIGAVLANVIGTTGASMLLIRPWIRMNRYRITAFHIVFFIFIISNVGGCLTPIGDPPLFLGYLKGVPFWWVLAQCWQAWLIGVGMLIGMFYFADNRNFLRAPKDIRDKETAHEEWRFDGLHNLIFITLIIIGVFLPLGWREVVMTGATLSSWFSTKRKIHESNEFNFHPIKEVAWLFAGIFITMVPALGYLERHATELGLHSETQFFWLTGGLSAALDNAPTYLAFLASAFGLFGLDINHPTDVATFVTTHSNFLRAISLGAVFFGAMTYIGNGPNFMVKAIAEHAKVHTPGFLGFTLKFALPILLPIVVLLSILFFSAHRIFG